MNRSAYGTRNTRTGAVAVRNIPSRIALNGHVMRDVEVEKGVTANGATAVAYSDTQDSADGSAVGMEKESSVAMDR